MRGSVYYQTSVLVKMVFKEGALKVDRINPESDSYMCIASFNTMNSYRQIWNNFGLYIREVYGIKNFEKSTVLHVDDYLQSKLTNGISKQYFQKLCSALSKLELALELFYESFAGSKSYRFKKRIKQVIAQDVILCESGKYINGRAYVEPKKIIADLENSIFKIAASIQLEGGARYKGIHKIKMRQLKGIKFDEVTNEKVGAIETKEKGGRVGDVYVSINTYHSLKEALTKDKKFEINYEKYAEAIRKSCIINGVDCYGSHGFRWNFAKCKLIESQNAGFEYEESLKIVSKLMKHNRTEISELYIS